MWNDICNSSSCFACHLVDKGNKPGCWWEVHFTWKQFGPEHLLYYCAFHVLQLCLCVHVTGVLLIASVSCQVFSRRIRRDCVHWLRHEQVCAVLQSLPAKGKPTACWLVQLKIPITFWIEDKMKSNSQGLWCSSRLWLVNYRLNIILLCFFRLCVQLLWHIGPTV
jgi:hypothetical protein